MRTGFYVDWCLVTYAQTLKDVATRQNNTILLNS